MLEKIPGAETVTSTLKGVADVGQIAVGLAQGKPPSAEQTKALLTSIPGMGDVVDIAEMSAKAAKAGGQAVGLLEPPPDDGKPKSCWLKSHGRGFGSIPKGLFSKNKSCAEGKEMSGGLCYDKCAQGTGVGPVCWGSCPAQTKQCGVLCLLEGESCTGMATKITKDAISTGVSGAGQDYLGAVKGAFSLVDNFTYPVCKTFNGLDLDGFEDDDEVWAGFDPVDIFD